MQKIKFLFASFTLVLIISSCEKPNGSCNTNNTDFETLCNLIKQSDNHQKDDFYMDREVHSYSFRLNTSKKLCQIGYQSLPAIQNNPYQFEIINEDDQATVYSGSHVFSSAQTSYVSVGNIPLNNNVTYTIRRIQQNYTYIDETIGRIIYSEILTPSYALNPILPFTHNDLTIIQSSVYNIGDTLVNFIDNKYLPYIDLVFE